MEAVAPQANYGLEALKSFADALVVEAGSHLGKEKTKLSEEIEGAALPAHRAMISPMTFMPVNLSFFSNNHSHHQVVRINQNYSVNEDVENSKKRDHAAAVIGAIAVAILSFVVGYFYVSWKNSDKALELQSVMERYATEIQQRVGVSESNLSVIGEQLKRVLPLHREIVTRNAENGKNRLASASISLIGAASCFVGGVAALPFLVTAGAIALVAGASFFLLNMGLHWKDEFLNEQGYRVVLPCAQTLRRSLWAYQAQQASSGSVEGEDAVGSPQLRYQPVPMQYEPVYPELPSAPVLNGSELP